MDVVTSIREAMRQTNDVFCAEVLKGQDLQALDRVYTDDARVLPPGAEIIRGRANVAAFWKTTITEAGIKSAVLTSIEADAIGDSVIEIGQAELVVAGGELVTAKYVVQWKQERGRWKWHIDIWNPNS